MPRKGVSNRCKKLIDMSDKISYSKEEILKLYTIAKNHFFKNQGSRYLLDLFETLATLKNAGSITDSLTTEETEGDYVVGETTYYELDLLEHLLVNNKRAFLFLTLAPLESVPLYLHDSILAPFAQWRLAISK